MTRRQIELKLRAIERELNLIAQSDAEMGIYDIEHLENARQFVRDLLNNLCAN